MARNLTRRPPLKASIPIQPNIGLDGDIRNSVIQLLNTILADEAVVTLKTHSAYWHVRGPGLLELRKLYEQQLHQLNTISDEVAERVRMMGGFAISSFKEILLFTRLDEQPGEIPGILRLLADHEASIRFLREDARKCYEEYEDHGTYTQFVRLIGLHEKMAWILRSNIEPDMPPDEYRGNAI